MTDEVFIVDHTFANHLLTLYPYLDIMSVCLSGYTHTHTHTHTRTYTTYILIRFPYKRQSEHTRKKGITLDFVVVTDMICAYEVTNVSMASLI